MPLGSATVGYSPATAKGFVSKVRRIDIEMENFSAEFLNVVERYLKKA